MQKYYSIAAYPRPNYLLENKSYFDLSIYIRDLCTYNAIVDTIQFQSSEATLNTSKATVAQVNVC